MKNKLTLKNELRRIAVYVCIVWLFWAVLESRFLGTLSGTYSSISAIIIHNLSILTPLIILFLFILLPRVAWYLPRILNNEKFLTDIYLLITAILLIAFYKLGWTTELYFAPLALFVLALIIKVNSIITTNPRKKERRIKGEGLLFTDEPIECESNDDLGMAEYIKTFTNIIASTPITRGAFVYSLEGPWGSGKSSALNLIKEDLCNQCNDIVVNFNPWLTLDESSLIRSFYSEIYQAISKIYNVPDLKGTIAKYMWLISSSLSFARININYKDKDASLTEIKSKLESIIVSVDARIIVFIDDLDRLNSREIEMVLKLVKANTNFRNMIYVLSYSRSHINELISESCGQKYLDKIIQARLTMPSISSEYLNNYLAEKITDMLEKNGMGKEEITENLKNYNFFAATTGPKIYKTVRDCKIFLNNVSITIPGVMGEICIEDYLKAESLRTFFPLVFEDVKENPGLYVDMSWSEKYRLLSPFDSFSEDSQKYDKIKKHVDTLLSKYYEADYDLVRLILEELFFEVKNALKNGGKESRSSNSERSQQRLCHPDCLYKYLNLIGEFSIEQDAVVQEIINSWNSASDPSNLVAKVYNNAIETGGLHNLLKILFLFRKKLNENSSSSVIEYIYTNINSFSEQDMYGFYDNDRDSAIRLILFLINDNYHEDKINAKLEEIIIKPRDSELITKIMLFNTKQTGDIRNIYKVADLNKMTELADNLLTQKYIKENRNILIEDKWPYILHQWSNAWGQSENKYSKKIKEYLHGLLIGSEENYGIVLRKYYTTHFPDDVMRFDLNGLGHVCDVGKLVMLGKGYLKTSNNTELKKLINTLIKQQKQNIITKKKQTQL